MKKELYNLLACTGSGDGSGNMLEIIIIIVWDNEKNIIIHKTNYYCAVHACVMH